MNRRSVLVLVFVIPLLGCQAATTSMVNKSSAAILSSKTSFRNTTAQAVNQTYSVNRPCIKDTLLPLGFKGSRKLWSEHKYFLQINVNGDVSSTTDLESPYAKLELESLGKGLFRAKSVATKRYLAMNRFGGLYTRITPNLESVFKKIPADKGFVAYINYVYCWYVGLKRSGQPKRGFRVKKNQHSAHFLELKLDNT